MSVESVREEIAAKRTEWTEIQAKSKATERELLDRKNDIVRMANEEYVHITQHEFEYPLPPLIS
jgi:hypothetical protein